MLNRYAPLVKEPHFKTQVALGLDPDVSKIDLAVP